MSTPFEPIISQNFNGGEVTAVEPVLLATNQLQKAINVRFSQGGGFTNRPGYLEVTMPSFSETSALQGIFSYDNKEIYFACNGKIFVMLSDLSNSFAIITGLSTTADVEFTEFNGDIYVLNGVDSPRRIARTKTDTALTAGVSVSVTVDSGQGWRFGSSGSVTVVSSLGVDPITYTSKANDVLTITAATVQFSHPTDSLIFEISTLSSAPKGEFGAEFQNTWFISGQTGKSGEKWQGNTLHYSRGAAGLNPEYFYDFTGTGAGFIPVGDGGDITGLFKTKTYLLIFKRNSIYYCDGFDSNGVPNIQPLSTTYGAAGKRAFTLVGDQVIVFTGKAIKAVGEQDGLNNLVPSVNARFDDKIFPTLANLDEDQSDAVMTFNPSQKLMKLWCNKDGGRLCVVYDDKIDAWSRDTNKPASCACLFKNETYWGSSSEGKLLQDEVGYSDNGFIIMNEAQTGEFNAGSPRLSKYFQYLYINGKLGVNSEVTVKIYFDRVLIQQFTLTDDLITPVGGSPIGRVRVGGSPIGSGSAGAALAYPFELEKLLKKRRDSGKISLEFIAEGEGQIFEITSTQIQGLISSKFDRKIRV